MAYEGTIESVIKLWREGHDINALDKIGDSVLDAALFKKSKENARFLKRHGAKRGKILRAAA